MKKASVLWILILTLALIFSSCSSSETANESSVNTSEEVLDSSSDVNETGEIRETDTTTLPETQFTPNFDTSDLGFYAPLTDAEGNVANPEQVATPLLYRVTDEEENVIWLFGSIHMGRSDMGEMLPSYVLDAYHSAEDIAVEADILSFEQDYERMINCLKELVYLNGTTIKDHLPAELYEAARQILADNGSYAETLDYYFPIMWSDTIETLAAYKLGFDPNQGVDRMLIQQAYNDGKKVLEIESAEYQYGMMSSLSPGLQEMLLASAVAGYGNPEYNQQLEEMVYAWCTGDADLLAELTTISVDPFQTTAEEYTYEYKQEMITTRNINMTEFAISCLKNKQKVFICVGAAHVVGEDGIAQALSRWGYTVEEIRG